MRKYENKLFLVPITKDLLLLGTNAYQSYKNYLETDKETRQKEENHSNLKAEAAEELKDLSSSLIIKKSEEQKRKKAADKLFDEATKRLENAVKRKSFEEITLAQGMLHG